jgi:hypothetical protein
MIARVQLDMQVVQQRPHFYVKTLTESLSGMTPNVELYNDGGTFDSVQVRVMPFISGFDMGSTPEWFNIPIYTHQEIELTGHKNAHIATIKSDLPFSVLQNLRMVRKGFMADDINPRLLLLVQWTTNSESGMQFFVGDKPIESVKADSCYSFWWSQSEESPNGIDISENEVLSHYASFLKNTSARKFNNKFSTNLSCQLL